MVSAVYEFEKIDFKKQKDYIFQLAQGRKLTDVYHSHDFYEWICILNGNSVQFVNERELLCEKNSVTLLRPTDRHCFLKQSEDVAVLSLSVEKEEFELFCNAYAPPLLARILKDDAPTLFVSPLSLLSFFDGEKTQNVTDYGCKLLLSYLLKAYIDGTDCLQNASALPPTLSRAIREMKKAENLKSGISAFTELSHYSQSHLSRLIKKHFGTSLKAYINELRLQTAYNEIVLTCKFTEEISEELGFSSFSHFNKIFKARFSITPAALRKSRGAWTA